MWNSVAGQNTMTIELHLSEEMEKRLQRLAAAQGYADVAAYVQNLVEHTVQQQPAGVDLGQEFAQLAEQWRRERGATSLARCMAEHPAYRRIVAMGDKAVPFILAELEREPDHWFVALHEITGASPVPAPRRGKLKEMPEAWISWGRKHGYHW
jgi:predicted transcriptional regulator